MWLNLIKLLETVKVHLVTKSSLFFSCVMIQLKIYNIYRPIDSRSDYHGDLLVYLEHYFGKCGANQLTLENLMY